MEKINIIFLSIDELTRTFINNLSEYSYQQYFKSKSSYIIRPIEIEDQLCECKFVRPFFVVIPSSIDLNTIQPINKCLQYNDNYKYCKGLICINDDVTTNQYYKKEITKQCKQKYNIPLINDKNEQNINVIYNKIIDKIS